MWDFMDKKTIILRINILVILISILSVIIIKIPIAQTEEDNIIYVDDDGVSDYTTIQEAIDAANEGDTVHVFNGIYYENIVIDKGINLIGADRATTIIDGNNSGDVVFLSTSSNYVNITGFTIQNSGSDMYDEGINVDSDYNNIVGNIIKDCTCGLSLDFWAHNCLVQDNLFANNVKGVSVYSVFPNNNIITLNNFYQNKLHAYDNSNGTWDYLGEGNYWDDYYGEDLDGDGVGDTPYEIPGGGTQDNYPLMDPHGTPGFEIVVVILAIAIIIFISRIRK